MPDIDAAVLPEHRALTLIRVLDAPRALVFKAFTDPVHLARWWGPHGFTTPVCEFDARPDGALRIHMRGPDGSVHVALGTVREIVAPERLVFAIRLEEADGSVRFENLTTVTFADHARGTELTLQVHSAPRDGGGRGQSGRDARRLGPKSRPAGRAVDAALSRARGACPINCRH